MNGPTSFHDLRTVNGHICETFREACNKRDLLEDDNHWNATLTEAAATDSPKVPVCDHDVFMWDFQSQTTVGNSQG